MNGRGSRSRVAAAAASVVALALWSTSCAPPPSQAETPDSPFDLASWLQTVKVLSSDAFEGRAPGTPGEEKTVAFLINRFRRTGLGAVGGDFVQPVPLIGITAALDPLRIEGGGRTLVLTPKDDFVAWTKRHVAETELRDSELVFVGYGVHAPEVPWDDFKGVDLTGKTLVVLIGDPPVRDPASPLRLDPKTFGGDAMTYYGRWVYKFDEATLRRAAGVLIVHETEAAGYAFNIVQGRLGELFDLRAANDNAQRPALEGWMTLERARAVFAMAGHDFDALRARAATRLFSPVPLGVTASTRIRNTLRPVASRNVVGRLEGADSELRDQHILVTAHWDAFGTETTAKGPSVKHGALDNASGVAGLLELARMLATRRARLPRSVLFVAVTAEEQGLLGSEYYVRNPSVPLEKTLAVLNFEMMNVYGKTPDLIVYGLGASDLDDRLAEAARRQGRTLAPDPAARQGWFYRSDHFPFARAGVPATWASGGEVFYGRDADYGRRVRDEYVTRRYHGDLDVVTSEWDLRGVADDLQIYADVIEAVARAEQWPRWHDGAEFKAARDRMLSGHRQPE